MAGIRRALFWAATGKYITTIINILTTAIVARLLTPQEYGLAVLGTAVSAMAEALRELGGGAYLIQNEALTTAKMRTTFTVSLIVTLIITSLLLVLSGPMARYFGHPEMTNYLRLVAVWFSMGPFVFPILALMTREMALNKVAMVSVATTAINAAATVVLALLGFSYMRIAWASVVSSLVGMLLGFYLWADFSMFRPLLRGWRDVLAFSTYDSATAVLLRIWESAPYFILARAFSSEAIGLVQRAFTISLFPERVIMAGVGVVALPAFSEQVRQGRDLRAGYMEAIEHITGLQWPALIVLALLAHPAVMVLLGSQWLEAVPLIQVICVALLFYFPIGLNHPLLVALGAIRWLPALTLVQAAVSVAVLWLAIPYGLHAAILTMLVTVPFNVWISMLLVRRHLPFSWGELLWAMRRSAIVAAASAVSPLAIIILSGGHTNLSLASGIPAGALAILGWVVAVYATGHPLRSELSRVWRRAQRMVAG